MLTITNEQKVLLTLAPKTLAGNPAQLEAGSVVWAVSEGDATVEPAADGLSAYLISGVENVVSTVTVTADGDLGEGVKTLTDSVTLTVVAAGADTLGFTAGEPELK